MDSGTLAKRLGAFSLGERSPVLAQILEPLKLVVIELAQITGGAVVE